MISSFISFQHLTRKLLSKIAPAVMVAFSDLQQGYGKHFADVFKTITNDSSQEFALLSPLERSTAMKVYFIHPFLCLNTERIKGTMG